MSKARKREQNEDYLSNKEMLEEVIKCQANGVISDRLGRMFLLLATRYATKPNFSGYSYVDEMISNAVLSCCQAVNKFDSNKSQNPFAYYTSVIHTAFIQVLNKERRHQEIRDVLLIEEDMDPSSSYLERHGSNRYDEQLQREMESGELYDSREDE